MARISLKIKKRPLLGRLIKIKYCVLAAIFKICAKTTPSCKFSACNINAAENTHIWPKLKHIIDIQFLYWYYTEFEEGVNKHDELIHFLNFPALISISSNLMGTGTTNILCAAKISLQMDKNFPCYLNSPTIHPIIPFLDCSSTTSCRKR